MVEQYWWRDHSNTIMLAETMAAQGDLRSAGDAIRFFEKPWHWDDAWALWEALGQPSEDDPGEDVSYLDAWDAFCLLADELPDCAYCKKTLAGSRLSDGAGGFALIAPNQATSLAHFWCAAQIGHERAQERAIDAASPQP